jgi:hypothetical protein
MTTLLATVTPSMGFGFGARTAECTKVEMAGEVDAGREWKQPFGNGWTFRLVPIPPGNAGYSGWDLVVDREPGAVFPDALLLATPPYGSINEREVGTTFGLRSQDAIGWNPRSFRFLTDPVAFRDSQTLFRQMNGGRGLTQAMATDSTVGRVMKRMQEINQGASAGRFQILDARLAPGTGDAAPFAENWAIQSVKTPHAIVSSSSVKVTPLGELDWMRFSITLWLPDGWKAPPKLNMGRSSCSE